MRWIVWSWALCVALGSFGVTLAQDDDDDESEIEIESGPEPEDEPKNDDASRSNATGVIPARAKDAKIEWREVTDSKKHYRLSVPSDWRIKESKAGEDLVEFHAMIPGAAAYCTIIVRERIGSPPPMALARLLDTETRDQQPDTRVELMFETLPLLRTTDGNASTLWGYLRLNGRSIEIGIASAPSDRNAVKSDFLAMAARLVCTRPIYPNIPEYYKVVKKGRFQVAVHPGAKAKLKPLFAALADQDKRFAKFHGKMPKSHPSPVVFVHASHSAGTGLYAQLDKITVSVAGDWSGQRLFALPMRAKNRPELSNFAAGYCRFAFIERYGVTGPNWARVGEANVGFVQALGGFKLPTLPPGIASWGNTTVLKTLDNLTTEFHKRSGEDFRREAFFYVLFFHCGPAKYRKAYKAFLEDLGRVDLNEARRRHLDKFGLSKLQKAATKFKSKKVKYAEIK